ncbi:MAG: exonuclease III [Thermoproteota archaeon]|jgi:exonuclease III
MKKIILFCFILLSFESMAKDLSIVSFNIRWFGIGGEMSGSASDEFRTKWLTEYIEKNLSKHDVIVFQEIVIKSALYKIMKPLDFYCRSYTSDSRKHQYVVICTKNHLEFVREKYARSYALAAVGSVNNSKLRPAVVGIVREKKTKLKLAHILGIHLKAMGHHTETRLKQSRIIRDTINKFKDNLPTVLVGDFNSLNSAATGLFEDDITYMKDIFADAGLRIIRTSKPYTYRVPKLGLKLDHFFISQGTHTTRLKILGPCNKDFKSGHRYDNIEFYNRFISDHCPISLTLHL